MTEEQPPQQPPRKLLGLAALQTLEGLLAVGNYEGGVFLTFLWGDERKKVYDGLERAGLIVITRRGLFGDARYQLTDKGRQAYQALSLSLEPLSHYLRELMEK